MRRFAERHIGLVVVFAAAALAGQGLAPAKPALEGFDAFVSTALKDWKVPGVAVAVVQDGKVILSKGYGFRDVKKEAPVTPKTLFAIGSITKSFTVTSLGILVDEGKLDWDKPVREYMPGFRLYDQVATERMTPRDLVTHRSGLPRHDLLWYNSTFSRKELFERLRYLEPSRDFRSTYQYNNLMFVTAGYLLGELTSSTWEDFVRQRIWNRIGMKGSNFSVRDSEKSSDFALPYVKVKEEVREVPFRVIDDIGPAGSINSNVEDMTRYLLMHMNKGKSGETQVLSESNILQMQAPQMVTPAGPLRWSELGHSSYGMGWAISAYRGHKLVSHGGAIDGFVTLVSFMPQDKIGMVILTNLSGSPVSTVLSYNLFDRLLGLDQVGWSERFQKDRQAGEASEQEAKKQGFTTRRAGTRPSHELKEYAAEYEHPGYGIVKVALDRDELKMTYNRITGSLKHFHYDYFEVAEDPLIPFQRMKIHFDTDVEGEIGGVSIPLETNVKDIVFTRRPETLARSVLATLAGQYELAGTTITMSLREGEKLFIEVPGQQTRELVPVRGLLFRVSGLSGFSVEFKKDASGATTELILYQPGGTFVVKRKP
jgi:CubicO group peptidase (beta-lactamase class C family)